jgi:hypothetical protein
VNEEQVTSFEIIPTKKKHSDQQINKQQKLINQSDRQKKFDRKNKNKNSIEKKKN